LFAVAGRRERAEHGDVVRVIDRRQRSVVGIQVHTQLGAGGLERVRDEPGRIHVMVPDDDHAQSRLLIAVGSSLPRISFGAKLSGMVPAADLTDLDTWARGVPYEQFARLRAQTPVSWSEE